MIRKQEISGIEHERIKYAFDSVWIKIIPIRGHMVFYNLLSILIIVINNNNSLMLRIDRYLIWLKICIFLIYVYTYTIYIYIYV